MKVFRKSFSAAMLAAAALTALAAGVIAADHTGYWRRADDETLSKRPLQRTVVPSSYDVFSLDRERLRSILSRAPQEFSSMNEPMVIELPMPDGTLAKFRVEHSLVVEQGLADKYPELGETYIGQGVDDPTATVRFDTLRGGFHAMVLSPKGTVMIDPYAEGDNENYITYYKKDAPRTSGFHCLVGESDYDSLARPNGFRSEDVIPDFSNEVISGTQLRTYRLALAANWEYCNAVGSNTVAGCLAAQVLIMNRVNGVYERDLSMRMVMVANNNLIVYAGDNTTCPVGTGGTPCTSANDPYSNGTGALNQNTANLNAVIGSANYDIGHVFTTGSGGVASLNVPCGASKGAGTTGLPNPVGDPFAIDYVAHEMGHQWGSNHTFNSTISNCGGGNRSAANAYEPGSGITVMAYAGICGNNDLASNSIDTFHVRSLEVIVAFSQTGNGNTCATTTATGNTPPSVSVVGANNWNIPKQTPFSLTASASDVNGDTITYDWQEYDLGSAATTVPNTDADGIKPIFRAYPPVASPTRFFPSLQYILNNANVPPSTQGSCPAGSCMTGELLPTVTRTMNFQVIARDNRAGGGGINTATATVNVDGNSGPFVVTAPNTGVTYNGGSSQTVTWNVANTTAAPVNAATVNILFSSDGGQTFPTVIASGTANDGTETVTIPNVQTAQARIKVEGSNNIFFDISDTNFTVNATVAQNRTISDFDGDGKSDV
ncbi:MAG: hypothetical protein KF736_11760, partial [Acidobacteria bacterium]|nr:hypothetical protein [Acidobacteriota bacterium]